jgi:integrase
MARQKLTTGRVRDFEHDGAGQSFLWDAESPGLGVRATAGQKAFVFQSRLDGAALRITIGDIRTWTLGTAREEARRLQTLVDRGIDPRQEKRELAAQREVARAELAAQELTVGEAWQRYLRARKPKWSNRHLADHEALAREGRPLHDLLASRLVDLDRASVEQWLRAEVEHRPTQAALAYRLLRALLRWCADTPGYAALVQPDACSVRLAKELLPRSQAKTDCLQREQLPVWFASVRAIHNPVISAYLQALLLTGARREELAGLRWEDVDFRWGSLTIRDKVEGLRVIPLTPHVGALLAALPRRNAWVFSSPTAASGRLQEPRLQHNKALAVAGIDALTLHGLRRSFGTLAEWVECPAGVTAQIMGHKPSAIAEKHYRQRSLDLLRQWHTRIEAWVLEQAGIAFEPALPGLRAVKTGD